MADVNTVVIVSDKQELINQVSAKLVLLRNIDKIKTCSIDEALSLFDSFNPNVLILHCDNNSKKSLDLVKQLKTQEIYKNLPVLLINENCSRETIIEAFDNGVNDVLFMPIIDYELLIRVIWCLQKNELNMNIESRENFLAAIDVIQPETGVYSQKYCNEFLKNEIEHTKKYSQCACILLIAPDKNYPASKPQQEFINVIKSSTRLNDSIIAKDLDKYYLYLKKTKLNGAYSVFERINNSLGIDCGINAGLVEIQNQKFEDIIEALDAALEKASENANSLIVASDFYTEQPDSMIIVDEFTNDESIDDIKKQIENEETQEAENTIKTQMHQSNEQAKKSKAFDKNSVKLFNQAYTKKLKVVIEPVFKKYENLLRIKKQNYQISTYIGIKSALGISYDGCTASFVLEYDGLEHVVITLSIVKNGERKLCESVTVYFTVLNYKQLSMMLSKLIDRFDSLV